MTDASTPHANDVEDARDEETVVDALTPHSGNIENEGEEDRVYIDARGAEMTKPSTFSGALKAISDLAMDAKRPPARLKEAITMVENLLVNYSDRINAELSFPDAAKDWPTIDTWDMPKTPTQAIAICLDYAKEEARNPTTADDIEDADEIDIEQMNIDIVRDLIGMHGPALDVMKPAATPKPRKSRAKAPTA